MKSTSTILLYLLLGISGIMQGMVPNNFFKQFGKTFLGNTAIKSLLRPLKPIHVENIQKGYRNQVGQIFSRSSSQESSNKKRFFDNKLFLKTFTLLTMGVLAEKEHQHQKLIEELKAEQLDKRQKMLAVVSDYDLTALYKWSRGFHLYKRKEELDGKDKEDIKKLFENYQLITGINIFSMKPERYWTSQDWEKAKKFLVVDVEDDKAGVHLDRVPQFLEGAKSILKTFVPSDNIDLSGIHIPSKWQDGEIFVNKGMSIGRLFTYIKLQQVIDTKKLHHVHLPLKVLCVKDLKDGKYISGEKASKILDDMLKVYIGYPGGYAGIDIITPDYELAVLAHRRERGECKLSENAHRDLQELIKEAPFDVGYDNIFSDENGDAVIIDTEFKGEPSHHCLPKLGRYK